MDIIVLNKEFDVVGIVDVYKSFIWADRYNEYGDFELHTPMDATILDIIKKNYYLSTYDSDRLMIVESILIESDDEDGAYVKITGRSLESILKRRIVWNKTIFDMTTAGVEPNLQNGIKTLLEKNVIKPDIKARAIDNFVFKESTDPKITKLTFEGEYLGEELYSIISKLCQDNDIGFKIVLNDNRQLEFSLYAGSDRSYGDEDNPQTDNSYIVFSPDFDNIFSTNYLDSDENLKNVTLVVGKSEYSDTTGLEITREQKVLSIGDALYTGLERREIFTDAISMSEDDGYGGTLSAEQYQARLKQRGIDTLMENTSTKVFDGEVDATRMYKYGEDFTIGDIVQLANEYGHEGRAYISEFIISSDDTGTNVYPTFKTIKKGVYESE